MSVKIYCCNFPPNYEDSQGPSEFQSVGSNDNIIYHNYLSYATVDWKQICE